MDAADATRDTPQASRVKQGTRRSRVVVFRVSQEEYARISDQAKKAKMTVAELLRDHLGKVTVTIPDQSIERQRNATLNRLNANLNMVAKWVNTFKGRADAFKVVSRLDAIQDEILRLIEAWEGKSGDRRLFQVRHRQR